MHKLRLLTLFSFLFFVEAAYGQSTEGKDFWFGFMSNLVAPSHEVYISSKKNVSGTVEVPGLNFSQSFTVNANTTTKVVVPTGVETANEGLANLAVHVTTCDTVTVYSVSAGSASSDATVVFPTTSLGSQYYILNSNGSPADFGDEFLIVATEDATSVEITPTVTSDGGKTAGTPFTIVLNKGEMYQMIHTPGSANFTYTKIESSIAGGACAPIAVFVGSRCINIGGCGACDHLYEQLLPVSALGKEYVLVPHKQKSKTWYRIMAIKNGTSVTINGAAPINLAAGGVHAFSSNTTHYVSSNEPISVMQYAQGISCGDAQGDPMVIQMFPIDQVIQDITFNCFNTPLVNTYWTNVVVKTTDVSTVTLDGNNVSASFTPIPSNTTYSFAQISLTQGNHTLNSVGGAIVTVYGWGNAESFGYCAGASIKNLVDDFTFSPNGACAGTTVNFTANTDVNALGYDWDFGDGSPIGTGISTTHQYASEGTFNVTLIKGKSNACNTTISKNLLVVAPPVQINIPDTSLCSSATLNLRVARDTTYSVEVVNGCDTSYLVVSTSYDSIHWSTGDTGEMVTITPTSDTVIYVFGYKNGESCVAMDSIVISVGGFSLDFTRKNSCYGDSNLFISSAFNASDTVTYTWDMGDGSPLLTGDTINYLYANPGTYTVQLTGSLNGGCQQTLTKTVTVHALPIAGFNFTSVCYGQPFQPTDISALPSGAISKWYWDFQNDGSIEDSTQTPQYTYTNTGNYDVLLVVQSDSGCLDSTIQNITVFNPPSPNFSFINACEGNAIAYTNLTTGAGNTSYWDFNSNGTIEDSTANPSYTFTTSGVYSTTLKVKDANGCINDTTINVEVYANPVANFSFDTVCFGNLTSFMDLSIGSGINQWEWDIEVSDPVTQNPTHVFSSHGAFQVALEVTNANGCFNSIIKTVQVQAKPLVGFSYTGTCEGETYGFTNTTSNPSGSTSTYTYLWDFGDFNLSTLANPNHAYVQAGQYSVTLTATDAQGCSSDTTVLVEVKESPLTDFSFNSVCFGENTSLTNQSTVAGSGTIVSNIWTIEGNTYTTMDTDHTFGDISTPTAKLTVVSSDGCVDSIIKNVQLYEVPLASFSFTPTELDIYHTAVCFVNESILGDIFLWDFGFNTPNSLENSPCISFPYLVDTTYTINLLVETIHGCKDSTYRTLTINEALLIYVPNSFTPDGDGKNDVFQPIYTGVNEVNLLIFNRWGELLFESDRANASWDGTFKGTFVSEDTYVYKITGRDILNKKFEKIGHVNVLR